MLEHDDRYKFYYNIQIALNVYLNYIEDTVEIYS